MMSQDFTNPALEQLFRLAPSADVQSTSEEVQAFIEQGGSVFDLLKLGRKGVVDTFGLHSLDAQTLMDKATSLAVHVARQFREQRLVRQVSANPLHQTGITSWVDTPSFDDLFEPDWENLSPADGVGSTISPASYFVKLVMLARALETRAEGNSSLLPLQDRRPDIANLVIDPVACIKSNRRWAWSARCWKTSSKRSSKRRPSRTMWLMMCCWTPVFRSAPCRLNGMPSSGGKS